MGRRVLFPLISLLLFAPLTEAATIQSLEQQLNAFKKSSLSQYAPATTSRIEAYLGAAMLADGKGQGDESASALKKAEEALAEAKLTATGFHQQYAPLLTLRRDAKAVESIISLSPKKGEDFSSYHSQKGDEALNLAIVAREQGELNNTRTHIMSAEAAYKQQLKRDLPDLSVITARLISKAASCGAKRYAPVTYQAANKKLDAIRSYVDGLTSEPPANSAETHALAMNAKAICEQVRVWRSHNSSYEEIIIRERQFRQQLAQTLGLNTANNTLLVGNSPAELIDEAKGLKKSLNTERSRHIEDIERLKKSYEAELQTQLAAQAETLTQNQRAQMADMKEVFRAKLERETYDKKRQAKLYAVFDKGDADILVNLDGSLLIRLTGLQFSSASSKIDQGFYSLLSRLKSATDIYADRLVRIEGHTDDRGDVKLNQALSLQRAEAVRDFLIAAGADATRLKALGYGEVRPIASNEFPQGRAMNRRIDIIISAPKTK